MATAFYSMVLDHGADEVWACIRGFGDYAWSGVDSVTALEEDGRGDQVGVVRRVQAGDRLIRQKLLAHSDIDRCYSYAYLEPAPVRNYQATIQVLPVIETGKAFVQWRATFDCGEEALQHWTQFFAFEGFAIWLGSLRRVMAGTRMPYVG